MEGSKAFAKDFMQRHSIPTAKFCVFAANEFDQASEYVKTCGFKVVLKASGLAAGKGVLIPGSVDEAITGLREIMVDSVFGAAGLPSCHVYHCPCFQLIYFYVRQRSCNRGAVSRTRDLCSCIFRWLHHLSTTGCSRS